jgi:hypothetical protein
MSDIIIMTRWTVHLKLPSFYTHSRDESIENHEKFILAFRGYKPRPVMLRYPARFVLLCAVHGYSL